MGLFNVFKKKKKEAKVPFEMPCMGKAQIVTIQDKAISIKDVKMTGENHHTIPIKNLIRCELGIGTVYGYITVEDKGGRVTKLGPFNQNDAKIGHQLIQERIEY